jgi:outer membrane receptor protein involved in Fe transport
VGLALFYKHFVHPIEQVVKAGADQSTSFANARSADNVGAEVDFKTRLGFVHCLLEPLYVGGNLALIYSRVQLDESSGIQTSNRRPLQGQSPYVINLQSGYENTETATAVSLLYNVAGPRIAEAGALGMPDLYESPFHQLDVVASKRLPMGLTVNLKAQNLIDQPVMFRQGGRIVESYKRGRAFVIGVGL